MASRFGVLLRDARRKAGYTQDELAGHSGVGVRTIRRLETGGGTDPRIGTVTLLADALGVTAAERRNLLAAADGSPADTALSPAQPREPGKPADDTPVVPIPDRLRAVPREVTDAADHLATVVAARLRREEELRRVHDPFPLPVRWRAATGNLVDHWDNICLVPAGVTAEPVELCGEVGDVSGIYRRVPSRKLVVLGRAGSGKTVLMLRFVLDALAARTPGGAVPVIFNIGAWDPTATPLRSWLVDTLQRDQPGLSAEAPGGSTLAAVLVDTERILPVLDGFDELAEGLRRPALEELNSLSRPMLLTSRVAEYEHAVSMVDVLTSAAVVELTDLTPDDLADYLPRTARRVTPDSAATMWEPVLTALRRHHENDGSAANLAEVLRTPLMVSLARTVYSDAHGRDPGELVDGARFPTTEAIERHLLDSFVPTVYGGQSERAHGLGDEARPRWELDRVRHWLGFLADELDRGQTTDLAWWRLGGSLRRRSRVLLVGIFAYLTMALVDWLFFGPIYVFAFGMPLRWRVALADGLLSGAVVAVPTALLYLVVVARGGGFLEPTLLRVRLFDRTASQPGFRAKLVRRFAVGAAGGALAGVAYPPGAMLVKALSPDMTVPGDRTLAPMIAVDAVVYGTLVAAACGLTLAIAAAIETPANLTTAASPSDLLAANRVTALRVGVLLALTLAVTVACGGFVVSAAADAVTGPLPWNTDWDPAAGLVLGTTGGLGVGLAYVLAFTAWGQWLVFARLRLPLLHRLPWAINTFLDDAYRRGVLRRSGAVYQFKHARLQQHLAEAYRTGR